jgi:hypothetical protein
VHGLHASSADTAPHDVACCSHCRVNGRLQRHVTPFDDDAWQPAEDNLDHASLIDSTARSIDIEESHAHTLD